MRESNLGMLRTARGGWIRTSCQFLDLRRAGSSSQDQTTAREPSSVETAISGGLIPGIWLPLPEGTISPQPYGSTSRESIPSTPPTRRLKI